MYTFQATIYPIQEVAQPEIIVIMASKSITPWWAIPVVAGTFTLLGALMGQILSNYFAGKKRLDEGMRACATSYLSALNVYINRLIELEAIRTISGAATAPLNAAEMSLRNLSEAELGLRMVATDDQLEPVTRIATLAYYFGLSCIEERLFPERAITAGELNLLHGKLRTERKRFEDAIRHYFGREPLNSQRTAPLMTLHEFLERRQERVENRDPS